MHIDNSHCLVFYFFSDAFSFSYLLYLFSSFSFLLSFYSFFTNPFFLLMYCVVFPVYYNGHDGKITCTYVSRHSNLTFSTDNGEERSEDDDAITTTSTLTLWGMREKLNHLTGVRGRSNLTEQKRPRME